MKLYDVYDGSKYIGELTLDEISELTGKTRRQISQAISGAYDILTQKIRRAVGWES